MTKKAQINSSLSLNYEDYLRWTLLTHGVLQLHHEIDACTVEQVMGELYLCELNELHNLTLAINSTGGEVYASLAVYDALSRFGIVTGNTISGFVVGVAASAASMIVLQACTTRLISPNAYVHLHELSRTLFGSEKKSESEDEVRHMKRLSDRVMDILSARTGVNSKALKKLILRRDIWMAPQEAIDYGLVDRIA
jgi:ATP-dependent Clp endopeptidase proteolytic subunit ClpP